MVLTVTWMVNEVRNPGGVSDLLRCDHALLLDILA